MDGSWKADSGHGVAAWEQVSEDGQEVAHQVAVCSASSASMVEIRAGISALQWAVGQGFFTDCAVFVQGLGNQRKLIPVCRQPC